MHFIVISSLEGWPAKAKEAPSPHEVRVSPLDTDPVFQCLGDNLQSIVMKTWKLAVNNNQAFRALLTDLSKAFNCLCHDLLIVKMYSRGLSLSFLFLMHPFSTTWKHQKTIRLSHVLRRWRKGALGTNGLTEWLFIKS